MDLMNRLMLGATYVVVGVVIGAVSLFAFRYYGGGASPEEIAATWGENGQVGHDAGTGTGPGYPRGVHIQQLYTQRAQIERLQRLLDQKTALLDRKTSLLNEKTAEQLALQAELDGAIDLLEVLAAQLAFQEEVPRSTNSGNNQLKTEVERLRADSDKSRAVAEEKQAELDLLMMELAVTDEEITQLEQESQQELELLLEERNTFETIVATAFAQLGEQAVTVLVNYLEHAQPDVRRWAAMALGEVGPAARDAIPPLLDALRDDDADVREAARQAIEKIDRIGPP
jgi:HEAT repeat protein